MTRTTSWSKALLTAALALALTLPATAHAADNTSKPTVQAVPPIDTETLPVPLRQLCDQIGAQITWRSDTQQIVIEHEDTRVEFSIGAKTALINGESVEIPGHVALLDGRTHIPLHFFSQTFEVQAVWNPETGQAKIHPMAVQALASKFIDSLQKGKFDIARKQFNDSLATVVPVESLKGQWQGVNDALGLKNVTLTDVTKTGVHEVVNFVFETERAPFGLSDKLVQMTFYFDANHKLDNFVLANETVTLPSKYQLPTYAMPDSYTETDTVIGLDSDWPLPAVLSLPKGAGPFPAVVLVHGSGPGDHDNSGGVHNKPFADLAAGLTSQGIAVLRYDKRNLVHSQRFTAGPGTMKEETSEDAVVAVDWLRTQANIDPQRIFVIGHSQGGMQLPNIIEADSGIAGVVSMAGPSTPLEDVRFNFNYLHQLGVTPKEMVDALEHDIALLNDPTYDPENPHTPSKLFSQGWMKSLYNFHPAEIAKNQTTPYLILQGKVDHQVPVFDFENWKKVLGDRPGVTYRLYDKLHHQFFELNRDGYATMEDYFAPNHIPDYVINDIATWVKSIDKQ